LVHKPHKRGWAAEEVTVARPSDLRDAELIELSHSISPAGQAVVCLRGELDYASAEAAVSYVTRIIDRYGGSLTADLSALTFCDARGLAALVRMAGYAQQAGCPFRLASPRPALVRIMRITGLHDRFLTSLALVRSDS
jgi:anti-anti-sigma factor